jgi:hypothetical protein
MADNKYVFIFLMDVGLLDFEMSLKLVIQQIFVSSESRYLALHARTRPLGPYHCSQEN